MTSLWQDIYTPQQDINTSIYDSLLIAHTDDEWQHTIAALPNDKAPGPSNISYEMLKKMTPALSEYLRDIVTLCFNSVTYLPNGKTQQYIQFLSQLIGIVF